MATISPTRRVRRAGVRVRQATAGALARFGLRTRRVRVDPKRSLTAPRYARRFGARWQVVKPAEAPVRFPPIQHGDRDAEFHRRLRPIPDLGVLWLDDPVLVGPQCLALSRERYLISSSTFWHGFTRGIVEAVRDATVERVRGRVISIGSDYAYLNYGHFLLDSLPRVALIEAAGISWDDADHVYCAIPTNDSARLLDQLGVPRDRLIRATAGVAIQPDRGIVTSYPGSRRNYPRWNIDFLRERLGVPAGQPSRRLYIPRISHRRILDIEQLMPILEHHGFEVFEPTDGSEDPRHAFAEAEVVVGGHGAGLADLVFAQPGTRVLELLPDSHAMPFYMTLSGSADLRYGYLMGTGVESDRPRSLWDYRIDPGAFRTALEATLR